MLSKIYSACSHSVTVLLGTRQTGPDLCILAMPPLLSSKGDHRQAAPAAVQPQEQGQPRAKPQNALVQILPIALAPTCALASLLLNQGDDTQPARNPTCEYHSSRLGQLRHRVTALHGSVDATSRLKDTEKKKKASPRRGDFPSAVQKRLARQVLPLGSRAGHAAGRAEPAPLHHRCQQPRAARRRRLSLTDENLIAT